MTKYAKTAALILIALALWGGAVSAAQAAATLQLKKELLSEGPLFAGDEADWLVTVTNPGGVAVEGIQVKDVLEDFLTLIEAKPSKDLNVVTNDGEILWSIETLPAHESTTLTLKTTITEDTEAEEIGNCAEITAPEEEITQPVCTTPVEVSPTLNILDVTIKPETLNLNSRGVITVFIRFSEETDYSFADLSRLECADAEAKKMQVTQKDGGTLMAKYRRQELVDVAAGEEVTITCEVTLTDDGEDVKLAGSDTLRVIGEKKKGLDAFFAGILDTVAPLDEVGEGTDETGTTPTATTTPALNRGQLKKQERNQDGSCTENCDVAGSQDTRGNGKKAGTDDSVTGSDGKGNQGKGNGNDADNGNGKGNSNKPDNEKGNGKNKK